MTSKKGTGKLLTREQILQAADLKEEIVECPEWGGAVKVRSLTLGQRVRLLEQAARDGKVDDLRFVSLTFIEGVSEPKLDMGDYMELAKKSNAAINRVTNRILALSGVGPLALDEAEKNSAPTQSDGSSTN